MSIRWTRRSVRSFVWNLTRSLFHFTSLFKFPVAKVVGTKPTPAEPRATPASAPKTAAPTIAALNFFLKRNTRIGSTSSPYFDRVVGQCPTPCNDRRKDSREPWSSSGCLTRLADPHLRWTHTSREVWLERRGGLVKPVPAALKPIW